MAKRNVLHMRSCTDSSQSKLGWYHHAPSSDKYERLKWTMSGVLPQSSKDNNVNNNCSFNMPTDKVQTTIIEDLGSRFFTPTEELASSHGIRPMAGDSITPNNYIPLKDSNTFFCPTRITLGSFDKDKKRAAIDLCCRRKCLSAQR